MLKTYFKCERTCARYYKSFAGPHLDAFVEWLAGRGHRHQTVRRRICGAARFADWGHAKGWAISQLNTAALNAFGRSLARQDRLRDSGGNFRVCFLGARHFLHFLQAHGITTTCETASVSNSPALFGDFRAWMLAHRGVAESTLEGYRSIVLDLLARLGEQPEQYSAKALREFVLHRTRHHNHASAQNVVSAVRMLLRFLAATGRCEPGLDSAIPNVAAWRLRTLPRWLPPEAIERAIDACDARTALGARDRAIVLLLARLGLRAGEVADLGFDDIDWPRATLRIRDKCRREARLPLPQTVGDALLLYLQEFRPPLDVEQLFVTTVAPYRPLRRVTVGQIATRALRRSGVATPVFGAYVFRHSAATTLLNQGVSLQTIAVVLRHTSLESTQVYAKVDQELLQEVALPWPGVTQC